MTVTNLLITFYCIVTAFALMVVGYHYTSTGREVYAKEKIITVFWPLFILYILFLAIPSFFTWLGSLIAKSKVDSNGS